MSDAGKKPSPPGTQIVSPARAAAFDILQRVETDNAFASVLLSADDLDLNPQDRALTYELVMGVLRRRSWLDRSIEHFAGRPSKKIDPPVLLALRLGLFQLRFLDRIPDSAAVNESVKLVYRARKKSAAGMANAVLRRALREPHFDPAATIADTVERMAVETSHPAWLLQRWIDSFGLEQTLALAHANNENPVTAFRFTQKVKDRDKLLDEFRDLGVGVSESEIRPGAWRVGGGASAKLQQYARDGLIYFQDEASQWVADVVSRSYAFGSTNRALLDVCAAPGSKTTQMAARLAQKGFVIAGDRYEHRLHQLRASAARQGISNLGIVAYDAETALPFPNGAFGTVLLDAPCSGTGTLRRNPEIRWRILPSDIAELAQKQTRILSNAARTVGLGGILFYSTCSIEIEENEAVVVAFLQDNPAFRAFDLRKIASNVPSNVQNLPGSAFNARFWPHIHSSEGFFAAAIQRTPDV